MSQKNSNQNKPTNAHNRITRRSFIRYMQFAGVGAFLGWDSASGQNKPYGVKPDRNTFVPSFPGRLVHVYDDKATFWDFKTGWYGYYVDQAKVDAMMEEGLLQLTNSMTVVQAWRRLIPKYKPGQTFAMKVNFNNFNAGGPDPDPDINALIEPVNALIRTMLMFGVSPSDISVYDVNAGWHSGAMSIVAFINRCLYPGVKFVYHYGNPNPFSSTEYVKYSPPSGPSIADAAIGNVVVDADYLINMFIPKGHSLAGATLGFKNHMGSIDNCQNMHNHLPYSYYYKPNYSCLLDVFRNRHFGPKTVLTVGDALFGNWKGVNGTPKRWITFGNEAPNSIFLAADPVAMDSVGADYVEIERMAQGYGKLTTGARDFLSLAEGERMGIFESADPWITPIGSDYKKIKYIYINGV